MNEELKALQDKVEETERWYKSVRKGLLLKIDQYFEAFLDYELAKRELKKQKINEK